MVNIPVDGQTDKVIRGCVEVHFDLEREIRNEDDNAVNRAIRAECPGSSELLEAMKLLDSTPQWDLSEPTFGRLNDIMAMLNASRDAMEAAALGLPDVPPNYLEAQEDEAIGAGKAEMGIYGLSTCLSVMRIAFRTVKQWDDNATASDKLAMWNSGKAGQPDEVAVARALINAGKGHRQELLHQSAAIWDKCASMRAALYAIANYKNQPKGSSSDYLHGYYLECRNILVNIAKEALSLVDDDSNSKNSKDA